MLSINNAATIRDLCNILIGGSDSFLPTQKQALERAIESFFIDDTDINKEIKAIFTREGKIPAIRYHRMHVSCGLKESKDYVERICSGLVNGAH